VVEVGITFTTLDDPVEHPANGVARLPGLELFLDLDQGSGWSRPYAWP
jgi:hypothetical protein